MSVPVRIQLSRAKGWRMPPNTAKVDRSTRLGNPWTVAGAREAGYNCVDEASVAGYCVRLFKEFVEDQPGSLTSMLAGADEKRARIQAALPGLRGKNLACWCKPGAPCHADVLLELANR